VFYYEYHTIKIMIRFTFIILALFLASCGSKKAPVVDPVKMQLALKDTVYNRPVEPEVGAERLQALLQQFPDKASWEDRKKCLREGLLTAMELNPAPKKTPLKPLYTGRNTFEHYTVDNVAFECIPGLWVCGNLYKPSGEKTSCPAVLLAHGHGRQEPLENCPRFTESKQFLAASLATMGVVVFAYDMFAYGESAYHVGTKAHRTSLAQSIQTWSSLRAIDFVSSLKEVDPARIGMTGESGGGTQTFLAAAIDERIALSAPVVQVSCFFPGGCTCESGRPVHAQCGVLSNNAEIAALAAPRPQIVVSDGKDWTRTVHEVEYPYLQTVYGYYGKAGLVENAHFADEGHDYGYSKRSAVLRFFAKHWGLQLQLITNADGAIDESGYTRLPAEQLAVFPDKQLPEGAFNNMEDIYVAFCVN
jgi:dienelactone hydrolase